MVTPSLALFDVALFWMGGRETAIAKKGETPHNSQIIELSPTEEGASP